jgi:hypothetical protein
MFLRSPPLAWLGGCTSAARWLTAARVAAPACSGPVRVARIIGRR